MIDKNGIFHLDNNPPRPGDLVEYGWYDQELEDEINLLMRTHTVGREDAIIIVLNPI